MSPTGSLTIVVARLLFSQRFSIHAPQKLEEVRQGGGGCREVGDGEGKIKEAAHLCAKPRARLAF
jgi:hypothetical protein